jgi:hypothetical protein
MNPKFICITDSLINWDDFLLNLHNEDLIPNCLARHDNDFNEQGEPYHTWLKNANYNWSNVKWTDYNLENTKTNVIEKFSNLVNSRMLRCFISKVDPGVAVATHWDEGDIKFYDVADKEKISRYTCFIQEPMPGHLFVVEDYCFYKVTKGSVYKWNNHKDFHSAANTGFQSHYIFHFLGEDYN